LKNARALDVAGPLRAERAKRRIRKGIRSDLSPPGPFRTGLLVVADGGCEGTGHGER